jgi:hypothetical protein
MSPSTLSGLSSTILPGTTERRAPKVDTLEGGIMKATPSPAVSEFRIQARRLLKALRSEDEDAWRPAAARFLRLQSFAGRPLAQLRQPGERVRLKHALTVLAVEHGFESWAALKETVEGANPTLPDEAELMYHRRQDVLLNHWFAHYHQAKTALEALEGFLFPYRHHFYICEAEGVRILGLDPEDPDWAAIGWNWVEPADREAWERLRRKRIGNS